MNESINTRDAEMFEQIAKLQGSATESIHIISTTHGDERLTVSAVTDYDDTFGRGGDSYSRPFIFQVRTTARLPRPVEQRFDNARFATAIEAYEWGRHILLTAADKVTELLEIVDRATGKDNTIEK